MIKIRVAGISALVEPSTAVNTTTEFAALHAAALGAHAQGSRGVFRGKFF